MKDFAQAVAFFCVFAVLFVPLIVSDSMFFPFITGKNFWFRILVEVGFAAWILLAVYDVRFRPRWSWLVPSMGALLFIMFFANLLGVHPESSFWSNFERMDGYVTLAHFGMYFITLGSLLSNKEIDLFGIRTTSWQAFFFAALLASLCVSFSAFRQLSGLEEITMGNRMNGTLGNAAYMAVYMLFSVFVALWVMLQSKQRAVQIACGVLVAMFVFLLFQTFTRGTMIGLAGGTFLGALYIAIFNTQYPLVRKVALSAVAVVVVGVALLVVFKDSSYVQNNRVLDRATAVNYTELALRFDIWAIALEGVNERPLLGYGQSNFNYVFNEYYRPDFSYRAEQWYDRAHNVFMDWLVTGGVLGLTAYLSLFLIALYYIVIEPFRKESSFTVNERGLILGIGAAYFVHNLVVFDNLVSYIFFALVLALVHSRVSTPILAIQNKVISPAVTTQIAAPLVAIFAILTVYFINVPSMQAAKDIIVTFRTQDPAVKLEVFNETLDRGSLGQQEIIEQMAQQALGMVNNPELPPTDVTAFVNASEERLLQLAESKQGDARVHVFLTSFYRGVGQYDKAREQGVLARELSPLKPHIILEQGLVEYQAGDVEAMNAFMKEAYEMAPKNRDAQVFYAASALLTGSNTEEVLENIATSTWPLIVSNELIFKAADQVKEYDLMRLMLQSRIAADPANPQPRVGLSFIEYSSGNNEAAIVALEDAKVAIPTIGTQVDCYISNLEVGADPNTPCS